MLKYLLICFVFIPTHLFAEKVDRQPYCKKGQPEDMFRTLSGSFEVIGKTSHGVAYSGALEITQLENTYQVTRTVNHEKVTAEAWVESCGPDKFQRLVVKYQSGLDSISFTCYFRGDGDNFLRSSCKSFDKQSLEAWFQSDVIMP
jgi:hypothetical protein